MIWIGFGFLMTFLRRYGQSAIGLTFLLGAIMVQVAMICEGVVNIGQDNKSYLSLKRLVGISLLFQKSVNHKNYNYIYGVVNFR